MKLFLGVCCWVGAANLKVFPSLLISSVVVSPRLNFPLLLRIAMTTILLRLRRPPRPPRAGAPSTGQTAITPNRGAIQLIGLQCTENDTKVTPKTQNVLKIFCIRKMPQICRVRRNTEFQIRAVVRRIESCPKQNNDADELIVEKGIGIGVAGTASALVARVGSFR